MSNTSPNCDETAITAGIGAQQIFNVFNVFSNIFKVQAVILVRTGILDFDKFSGTGLIPMTPGPQNAENLPDWSTGSRLMNFEVLIFF